MRHWAQERTLTLTLPFKECCYAFEVSSAIYVKSFEQHASDLILLNKATRYFHKTLIRHCLCFVILRSDHCDLKTSTVIFFWTRNINIGVFKRHDVSYEKRLEIVF